MSRAKCSFCDTVVSTTADPNTQEGYFISLAQVEELEIALQNTEPEEVQLLSLRGTLRRGSYLRLVICPTCKLKGMVTL